MNVPKPIRCSEVRKKGVLSMLLMHKLDEDKEDRILAHLRTCPECLTRMALTIAASNEQKKRDIHPQ